MMLMCASVLPQMTAVAQTALQFGGGTIATAEVGGQNVIPTDVWSIHDEVRIIVPIHLVRAEDGSPLPLATHLSLGFEGWHGGANDDKNSWVVPGNSQWMGDVVAQRREYMPLDVPGLYRNRHPELGTGSSVESLIECRIKSS